MFTQIAVYFMILTAIYLNIVVATSLPSTNLKQSDLKRFSDSFFDRFGVDSKYRLTNRPYSDDNIDKDMMLYKKQQLKKKWAKFFQESQSPYTIAFPALIRTRRWIEEEQ